MRCVMVADEELRGTVKPTADFFDVLGGGNKEDFEEMNDDFVQQAMTAGVCVSVCLCVCVTRLFLQRVNTKVKKTTEKAITRARMKKILWRGTALGALAFVNGVDRLCVVVWCVQRGRRCR